MSYGKKPCAGQTFVSVDFCRTEVIEGRCKYKRCKMYQAIETIVNRTTEEVIIKLKGQQENVN